MHFHPHRRHQPRASGHRNRGLQFDSVSAWRSSDGADTADGGCDGPWMELYGDWIDLGCDKSDADGCCGLGTGMAEGEEGEGGAEGEG